MLCVLRGVLGASFPGGGRDRVASDEGGEGIFVWGVWVCAAAAAGGGFSFESGDLGLSWLIWLYEGTQPFLNAITVVTTLFVAVELLGGLAQFLTGAVKGDWEMAREAAEGFWAMLVLSIFPVAFIYMTIANEI